MAISFLTGQSIDGNLSVLGGSITLGGISGRISGIVTVLSGTDAANSDRCPPGRARTAPGSSRR